MVYIQSSYFRNFISRFPCSGIFEKVANQSCTNKKTMKYHLRLVERSFLLPMENLVETQSSSRQLLRSMLYIPITRTKTAHFERRPQQRRLNGQLTAQGVGARRVAGCLNHPLLLNIPLFHEPELLHGVNVCLSAGCTQVYPRNIHKIIWFYYLVTATEFFIRARVSPISSPSVINFPSPFAVHFILQPQTRPQ